MLNANVIELLSFIALRKFTRNAETRENTGGSIL